MLLSDVFGYASFGCWLMVLLPQLWLNYRRKSSDGLSLGFILMWLAGDFADWYGAYVGQLLLPTILIGLYFVVTDVVLLAQMFCYRKSDDDIFGAGQLPEGAERPPLLMRRGRRACRLSGPGSDRRRLAEYCEAEREALLDRGLAEHQILAGFSEYQLSAGPEGRQALTGSAQRQISAGFAAYGAIPRPGSGSGSGARTPPQRPGIWAALRGALSSTAGRAASGAAAVLVVLLGLGVGSRALLAYYPQRVTDVVSQIFGYTSAAMFFIAYIPQIAWNFTAQSTEGLSVGMFVCTVLGNVTYCLSILAVSTEREYLATYAPWLAGAAGTLGFEALVLWQCYFYSKPRSGDDDDDDGSGGSNSGSGDGSSSGDENDKVAGLLGHEQRQRRRRRRRRNHRASIDIRPNRSRSRAPVPRIFASGD
ncbi:putative vacuolar membrane transporter for cationic amino acids [Coemansia javaensis]|uniref:Vacuolar membrane transporter for cationic amino acids n=1 Tax=Coemansia javaensis TaxID=2761396 RepID=A0A9W8HE98_9FUNG|nr:putative vacuolar membrane transporter for cationic amino acids [Coemansia javaensis]